MRVRLLVATMFVLVACGNTNGGRELQGEEALSIAMAISEGGMTQVDLIELGLTKNSKEMVATEFAKIRGWNIAGQENLDIAVKGLFEEQPDILIPDPMTPATSSTDDGIGVIKQALGACAQPVEQANGTTGQAYTAAIQSPSPGECGPDTDDVILVFNIYWGGTDPDNARYYSTLWWVRSALSACYGSGLSTNGLCSYTAHSCVGSCGQILGDDLYYVYLWHT